MGPTMPKIYSAGTLHWAAYFLAVPNTEENPIGSPQRGLYARRRAAWTEGGLEAHSNNPAGAGPFEAQPYLVALIREAILIVICTRAAGVYQRLAYLRIASCELIDRCGNSPV